MKHLTKKVFYQIVNESAATIHRSQGELGYPWPDVYIMAIVTDLTILYQKNFTATIGDRYIVMPHKAKNGLHPTQIFEVKWLVAGLLGIALARQAVIIHREPKGLEPTNADARIAKMVRRFLKEDTEEVLKHVIGLERIA